MFVFSFLNRKYWQSLSPDMESDTVAPPESFEPLEWYWSDAAVG